MKRGSTTSNTEDRPLVEEFLRTRGEGEFRLLYRRHTPRMYAMAMRLLGGVMVEAEEAVQESWVRAIERLNAFEWRSALSTWLIAILINRCRERIRQRGRREVTNLEIVEGGRSPAGELQDDLERAIARLSDGAREILVLHDVAGFTHAEIAERLGIQQGTSKSQLSRARAKLRHFLSDTTRNNDERRA